MENSSNIPTQSYIPSMTNNSSITPNSTTTSGSDGLLNKIKNSNTFIQIIILFVLAFLVFTLYSKFSTEIQSVTTSIGNVITSIFDFFGSATGTAIDVTAEGAKDVVGGTANIVETGLTDVQNAVAPNGAGSSSTLKSQQIQSQAASQQLSSEQKFLNNGLQKQQQEQQQQQKQDYEASEASSTVNTTGSVAWCYVGEDRGFRTCAQVGVNDKCMSGDIFPTNELCINPNLRA
jgi:hypothetical protein